MTDTATQLATAKAEKTKGQSGRYVIFSRDASGFWSEESHVDAPSAEAAIRKHGKEGTFVAIPIRSWRIVIVKAQTKTTLELKPAS